MFEFNIVSCKTIQRYTFQKMPPIRCKAEYLWDQGLQVLQEGLCTLGVHEHLDDQ